jgi:hypothetical protein
MTIPVLSWRHPFAGTSRSQCRARFIPARAKPAAHYRPVLHHAVEYGSSGQSAIISGYQLAAILGTISPAKAAALPNPHRRLSA